MKLYLASGYSVMNITGKERELKNKFNIWRRLISFFDLERGNKIMNVINLNYEKRSRS